MDCRTRTRIPWRPTRAASAPQWRSPASPEDLGIVPHRPLDVAVCLEVVARQHVCPAILKTYVVLHHSEDMILDEPGRPWRHKVPIR